MRIVTAREQAEMLLPWRTAMPRADSYTQLPQGYQFHFHPEDSTAHAYDESGQGSTLKWFPNGEIKNIYTDDGHRGKGLATTLVNLTQQQHPDLQHSEDLTPGGREWAKKMFDHQPPPPDDPYDVEDIEGSNDDWEVPHAVQEHLKNQESDDDMLARMKREWQEKFPS